MTPRLTLNLGIRWEGTTNATALHNDLYTVTNYATDTTLQNVPNATFKNPNLKNWDPRFGFAYDMFADHKTSLRGGFAITHDPVFVADYNGDYTAVTPWPGLTSAGFTYPTANFAALGVTNSISPGWDYYNTKAPYLIQYNLNIQRDLGQGTVLTVGYVGSHGVDMYTQQERNPPVAQIDANGVYHFGYLNAAGSAIVENPAAESEFQQPAHGATQGTTLQRQRFPCK